VLQTWADEGRAIMPNERAGKQGHHAGDRGCNPMVGPV